MCVSNDNFPAPAGFTQPCRKASDFAVILWLCMGYDQGLLLGTHLLLGSLDPTASAHSFSTVIVSCKLR